MLPKALLCVPKRGGARHRGQGAQATLRRCKRWLEGEREELWEDLDPRLVAPSARASPTAEQRHSRCKQLAAEGSRELSRACSALVDPPPSQATAAVQAELRSKHPQAPPPVVETCNVAAVPEFSADEVARAVRSFLRGSVAGPSHLRPDHLRAALRTPHADEVVLHVGSLCQLLARGEAPAALAPHLAGATLHALPKKQAVGELLRLCRSSSRDARQALWPLQLGVGIRGGAELIVHGPTAMPGRGSRPCLPSVWAST